MLSDVGGNLLGICKRSMEPWTPILRSNHVNLHPLWFALYGGIVYHHGAGFRDPMSRSIVAGRPGRVDGNQRYRILQSGLRHIDAARNKMWGYRQMMANRRLGDELFEKLVRDRQILSRARVTIPTGSGHGRPAVVGPDE